MSNAPVLPISLVIVSDFEPGPKTWHDEDECLQRSMDDPNGIPAQVVVAASAAYQDTPPPDWSHLPVPVKVVFVDSEYSGTIKNGATEHATQDLLAVVEADCISTPGWLNSLYTKYQQDPAVQAVTGLTTYEPTSAMRRVSSLYDRGYLRLSSPNGDAKHISNNGALYTRALLLEHPYENDASPFVSAHKRQMQIFPSGHRVALADDAVQYHAYGGWPFILDLRKNKGLQYQIMKRYLSDTTPNALQKLWWPIRMLLGGLRDDFILLTHFFGKYCKPSDIFLAVIYPFFTRPVEILGAVQANAGKNAVEGSAYR